MTGARFEPGYRALAATGELERRAAALEAMLARCELCPRACRVDRRHERGECRTGTAPVIASWNAHFGEEPPLSGARGSGTIFLANCNLRCAFCQNADISQSPHDFLNCENSCDDLADVMLRLQTMACHNINWVSPTHQIPMLVRGLAIAARRGLRLPIVYNTNAYESLEVLRLLDGIVDIYLPDLKYADDGVAQALSGVTEYTRVARAAIADMHRQVGAAWLCAADGALQRGLFVRILVLPGALAGAAESVRWLAQEVSPKVPVSLMSQYRPCHRAHALIGFPALARAVSAAEYRDVLEALARWNASDNTYLQPHFALSR
jgi:putative pyruvate formate lyase activating enzyme